MFMFYINVCVCVCTCVYENICVRIHIYIYIYTYTYICVHIYIYIYIYTYTHIYMGIFWIHTCWNEGEILLWGILAKDWYETLQHSMAYGNFWISAGIYRVTYYCKGREMDYKHRQDLAYWESLIFRKCLIFLAQTVKEVAMSFSSGVLQTFDVGPSWGRFYFRVF